VGLLDRFHTSVFDGRVVQERTRVFDINRDGERFLGVFAGLRTLYLPMKKLPRLGIRHRSSI
jgi:hypothetical protein